MNKSLPLVSAYHHPMNKDLIFIKNGQSGYMPASFMGIVDDKLTADKWNAAHNITKGEAEAMFAGSMWGWDVPAAKPESYTNEGTPIARRADD